MKNRVVKKTIEDKLESITKGLKRADAAIVLTDEMCFTAGNVEDVLGLLGAFVSTLNEKLPTEMIEDAIKLALEPKEEKIDKLMSILKDLKELSEEFK